MIPAASIRTPPIVGVPALPLWLSGTSSRMFWPMFMRRTSRMREGPSSSTSTMESPPAAAARKVMYFTTFNGPNDPRKDISSE